jgi:cytoskeleton protein RodZ
MMNPVQAMSPDEPKVVEFSDSPGRRLRVQRQTRGLELERVAAQLHLRVPVVEALEQDNYKDLPSPVFVAGYLRNYARLLDLDPEPLIAAYRAAHPPSEPDTPRFKPGPRQAIGHEIGSGHILVRLISLGLIVAVIAMVILWWQNRVDLLTIGGETATTALGTSADEATPLARNPADATAVPAPAPAVVGSLPLPTPAQSSLTGAQDQTPGPVALALPAPAATPTPMEQTPPPAPTPAPNEVVLSFAGPSWVNVRDAAGTVVLNSEMRKGDTRVLTGTPPYKMVIGNARSVTLTVGGQPVALGGSRAQGGTARLTLDPAKIQ